MKKFIVLTIVLTCANLFAQGNFKPIRVRPSSIVETVEASITTDSCTFWISTLGTDTSATFDAWPFNMSNNFWCGDTSGDDSVDIDIEYWSCTRADDTFQDMFDSWVLVESWTITADSVVSKQAITDNTIPLDENGRYVVKGGADNKVKGSIAVRIKHQNATENYNTAAIKRR